MKKTTTILLSTPVQGLALSALLLAGLAFATGTTEASQAGVSPSPQRGLELAAASVEAETLPAAERSVRQVGPVFLPDNASDIDLKRPVRSGIGLVWTWLVDEPDHAPASIPAVEVATID